MEFLLELLYSLHVLYNYGMYTASQGATIAQSV
jgi:hypothetical protein